MKTMIVCHLNEQTFPITNQVARCLSLASNVMVRRGRGGWGLYLPFFLSFLLLFSPLFGGSLFAPSAFPVTLPESSIRLNGSILYPKRLWIKNKLLCIIGHVAECWLVHTSSDYWLSYIHVVPVYTIEQSFTTSHNFGDWFHLEETPCKKKKRHKICVRHV